MLNKKIILAITASALLLGACEETQSEDNNAANTEELEARIAELENENEALRSENSELLSDDEETEEPVEQAEEETEESDTQSSGSAGTRSDPVTFGETINLQGTFADYDADWEEFDADLDITIIESIRGEEAWNIISNENQFNDPAPEGKEYIINRVRVLLKNATSDDLKTTFSDSDFDYISSSGSSYSTEYAVIPDELNVELFNDGQSEGNIMGVVDIDDTPLIRYESSFFFESE